MVDNVDTAPALDGKRLALVRAAADLFEARGYHSVNVGAIAAAAGLKQSTLYHYFRSKEEILYWVHDSFISELLDREAAREGSDLPPEERLRASMRDVLEVIADMRGHVRVFFENFRELAADDRRVVAAKRDRYQRLIVAAVTDGIRSGEFRDVDPRLASLAFFGLSNWTYQWYRPDGPLAIDDIADFFTEILMSGLRAAQS